MIDDIGKNDAVEGQQKPRPGPHLLPFNGRASITNSQNDMRILPLTLLSLLLVVGSVPAGAADHSLHGSLIYTSTSPMADFSGTNTSVTGTAAWDGQSGKVSAEVLVDLAGWSSGSALREKHTFAMFEVDRFPKASFSVTGVAGDPARTNVTLKGTLDLHGVKRPLEVPGTLKVDQDRLNFGGDFTLRLTEWGMKRPSLLGAQVDDIVKVHIQAEASSK
jgi:polyisoprenoid-binding protein YceI